MFQDRQPLYGVVPPLMPDAKLMHSCCTFAQVNLSIDRLGSLATVRNDRWRFTDQCCIDGEVSVSARVPSILKSTILKAI